MAAPSVGVTPAGKHRDQAAAIIRKHEEPPQGGSFIFVHLRMSANGPKRTLTGIPAALLFPKRHSIENTRLKLSNPPNMRSGGRNLASFSGSKNAPQPLRSSDLTH